MTGQLPIYKNNEFIRLLLVVARNTCGRIMEKNVVPTKIDWLKKLEIHYINVHVT